MKKRGNRENKPENLIDTTAEPYAIFAEIYDEFMDHVPYDEWSAYLIRQFGLFRDRKPYNLLDLACGSGNLLTEFSRVYRKAINMRGMDGSEAMLERARLSHPHRAFTLARLQGPLPYENDSLDWVVCTHDSLNYLLTIEDLESHFREVFRLLRPGGIYSFDSVSKDAILRRHDGFHFEGRYGRFRLKVVRRFDRRAEIVHTDLEFHGRHGRCMQEYHRQRFYAAAQVRKLAGAAGFDLLCVHGSYKDRAFRSEDDRFNFHFQKKAEESAE